MPTPMTSFFDFLLMMIYAFFLIMAISIFFRCLMDIFMRNDLSGGAKVGWLILIFILPLLGCLFYLLRRPKMTAQDVQAMARAEAAAKAVGNVSPADELAKLTQLRDSGAISATEFDALKAKIVA